MLRNLLSCILGGFYKRLFLTTKVPVFSLVVTIPCQKFILFQSLTHRILFHGLVLNQANDVNELHVVYINKIIGFIDNKLVFRDEVLYLTALSFFLFIWRCHYCWRRTANLPMLCIYGLWVGRDLNGALRTVTQGPGFCCSILRVTGATTNGGWKSATFPVAKISVLSQNYVEKFPIYLHFNHKRHFSKVN